MNFKTTIVLFVLLAGAAIYVTVSHDWNGKGAQTEGPTATESAQPIVATKADEIDKLVITPADQPRIVMQKTAGQWKLLEPVAAPAESFQVDDLLRQLTALQSRGTVPRDKFASVGLEHPSYTVALTDASGKTTTLAFGEKNDIGDALYVRVDDAGQAQVVPSAVYSQLRKPAKSYRSTRLLDVTEDQIRQLRLTRDGKTIRLEKQDGQWQIVEPKQIPADASAVSNLLSNLTGLNANEFVEGVASGPEYGLKKPVETVWFSTAEPTTRPATEPATAPAGTTITFGNYEDIAKNNVYASIDGGPPVTVAASAKDAFNKTALDLRSKTIADIDPAHVERFTLSVNRPATTQPTTRPAKLVEYTIARRKETFGPSLAPASRPTSGPSTEPTTAPAGPSSKWVFESGEAGAAGDSQVESLLSALHPLQATGFVENTPETQPADTYTLTVHVGPENGKGPQDYTFHFTNPGPTGNVIGTYDGLRFDVDRSILEKLDANFEPGK